MLTTLSGFAQFYLTECEALGKAPTTRTIYRHAIEDFLRVAPENVGGLDRQHCIAWIAAMRRRGMREGGIASYQRAVWTFLRWLHRNEYMPVDLSAIVPRVKPRDSEIHRPTAAADAIADMIKVASHQHENSHRNKALVAVFADTGIRRAELAMVDFEDVDMTAGTLFVRHGKGGKQRLIGIGAEARAALWEYFVKKRGMKPGPLFLSRQLKNAGANAERRMSAGAMADVLEDLRRLANTDITSHQFRRYTAARMLRQGAHLDTVMGQLGHDGSQMTLTYGRTGRDERNIQEFHRLDSGVRRLAR